jgi:hypothetical protein
MFTLDLKLDGNPILDADPNCKAKEEEKKTATVNDNIFLSLVFDRSTTCIRLFTKNLDV